MNVQATLTNIDLTVEVVSYSLQKTVKIMIALCASDLRVINGNFALESCVRFEHFARRLE